MIKESLRKMAPFLVKIFGEGGVLAAAIYHVYMVNACWTGLACELGWSGFLCDQGKCVGRWLPF